MYQQSQQIRSQEGNDPQFAKVIEAYDSKQRQEQERAMNREAKLELNQDLKEFEQAKFERDPAIVARLLFVGRDCLNVTTDKFREAAKTMRYVYAKLIFNKHTHKHTLTHNTITHTHTHTHTLHIYRDNIDKTRTS
jgi:hypothetical protein